MIRLCLSVVYSNFTYFIVILINFIIYNDAYKCIALPEVLGEITPRKMNALNETGLEALEQRRETEFLRKLLILTTN